MSRRRRIFVFAAATTIAATFGSAAWAGKLIEFPNMRGFSIGIPSFPWPLFFPKPDIVPGLGCTATQAAYGEAPVQCHRDFAPSNDEPSVGLFNSLPLFNLGATTDPGEPSPGGAMKKSLWTTISLPKAGRVVVHSFGSTIDTALAAYSGKKYSDFRRVAFNDDTPVAGLGSKNGLIQFDARADQTYFVQIGSPSGAEDDIALAVTAFPPRGGLTAYLAEAGGSQMQGRKYVTNFPRFFAPVFLLHNSMDEPLRVEASSDLGRGFRAPADITLAPGEAKIARFTVTDGFDAQTPRAISGAFTFTGRIAGKVATVAKHPALVVVKDFSGGNTLSVTVDAHARGARDGEASMFLATVKNTAKTQAFGCHVSAETSQSLSAFWRAVDPQDEAKLGKPDEPFSIPPGKSRKVLVAVRSHGSYFAEPFSINEVRIGCANADVATDDVSAKIDVTARGQFEPADIVAGRLSPRSGTVVVPEGRAETVRFVARNLGAKAKVTARANFAAPFDDPANSRFTATICQTDAKGVCKKGPTPSVEFQAVPQEPVYFKLFVTAPDVDPGFDADRRRMVLVFEQPQGGDLTGDQAIGATSFAVRKK
ncbi:hypothetical protein [Hansschlegelia zhihuaiae]|uniref:Uncharacterized protein n=1 Tax=Hansschlegelia zhihuaiae TaxID=405005 RepID=A0A4Q0MNU3_9HYPH|nr:hypothetical protein [Hansschlegelia zhihuaiae]RXF75591.1 hypothetical protein EK403_01720 [Hansschlegelia zhihuaiae]